MKVGFLDKLIARLDRLDADSLQTQFLRLVRERGLLETVFQSIQEGVVVVDASGKVSYANKAAEQLLGFSMQSAMGKPASRYMREIDWSRISRLDGAEWSKLVSSEVEITYPQRKYVNCYVVPLSGEGEDAPGAEGHGLVVILRDVTDTRQREASMVESERLNAVKLLAAGIAHEIGNPLNALNIHLQLLEREAAKMPAESAEKLTPSLTVARNEVARLDLVVAQFLRALRPSKPRLVLSRMETLIEETLSLLQYDCRNKRIKIGVECDGEIPRVRADRNQMKQAFFNVIRNAVQSMPDGGSLKISLRSADRFLAVVFTDSGAGIRRKDMSRIFDPFYTTKQEGSGLGLMIVQRVVHDHGGRLEITSKPGGGTEVAILLPLAEPRLRLLKAHSEPGRPRRRKT